MTKERQHRLFARFFLWQLVIAGLVGWNVLALSEPWTNWLVLSFACQAVLLVCAYRVIRRHEDLIAHWVAFIFRKIER